MPAVSDDLADEMLTIDGTTADATDLTPGGKQLLGQAELQIFRSKQFVDQNWPPLPAGDD